MKMKDQYNFWGVSDDGAKERLSNGDEITLAIARVYRMRVEKAGIAVCFEIWGVY